MVELTVLISVIALALLINVAALCAGHERRGFIHNAATVCGGIGIFALLGLFVAFLDAFFQIWVKRPGYEGQPVFWFFYATTAATLGSLATTITIGVRDYRSKA